MRSLLFVPVLALSALVPAQTRQLQADGHRYPAVHLAGRFEAYACGDVDGDGDLDYVAAHANSLFGSATVVLFRRVVGSWQQVTLTTYQGSPGVPPWLEIALADLDGDLDLDALVIVAGSTWSDERFELFQNTGGTPQLAGAATLVGSASAAVATGDVDGDGFASAPTLCIPIVAFGPRASPLAVAGIRGTWQLDITTTATLPLVNLPAPRDGRVHVGDPDAAGPRRSRPLRSGPAPGRDAWFHPGVARTHPAVTVAGLSP